MIAQRSGRAQKFLGINLNTAMPLKSRPGRNRRRLRAGCCWPRACQAVTPSNNYPGLRLGLRIALQIAQAHGGTLEVTSTLKETRFVFRMRPWRNIIEWNSSVLVSSSIGTVVRPLLDHGDITVLACSHQHREKLTVLCRRVLADHGP